MQTNFLIVISSNIVGSVGKIHFHLRTDVLVSRAPTEAERLSETNMTARNDIEPAAAKRMQLTRTR